jgi:phosphoribosylamine--glycine ligase / phosphoribosylformylglycinamidine cyclo-ligase
MYNEAKEYLSSISHRTVLKADGLAAGKGVILPTLQEEAHQALEDTMETNRFGDAGSSVVIEEYLDGQAISVSTLSDGKTTKTLSIGQITKGYEMETKGQIRVAWVYVRRCLLLHPT